jgi:competence protein ComEC
MWWQNSFRRKSVILKLSHHGSADQDPEFLAWVHPLVATISVGANNGYGHPTQKALNWLDADAKLTLRTDKLGSISLSHSETGLTWSSSGQDSH